MLRGYHESVISTLFRPLTLELCSRPPSCLPAKYPSLNSNKMVLQICSLIALRRVEKRLCEVSGRTGGVVRYNPQPPKPTLCSHAYKHIRTWTPLGILLKQTMVLHRAVYRSVSAPDEDGVRLFFLFRDVMGFYSCPSA